MRPHFFNFEQIVVQPKLALSITFASMHVQRLVALIRIEEEAPASQTKNRWHDRCRNCRREDSNLHSLNGNQVLNLARLPIPPLRRADSHKVCQLGGLVLLFPPSARRQGITPFKRAGSAANDIKQSTRPYDNSG